MKTPLLLALIPTALLIALALPANWHTQCQTAPYLYTRAEQIPAQKAALLLGTSPTLADGRSNLYFAHRIRAAAKLYRTGKVRYIIASGDNRKHGYNEPEAMKAALIAQGIPAERIIPDYAGIRTLGSVDDQLLKQILRQKMADARRKREPMPSIGECFQRGRCCFMA